ncbi:calmodulin-binding transcription activator 5-like isoform X2 [Impatiens glandulifera]|uniref:calmodulin-binding transcription activator 5-like isoform X2 n=1 Tax=Impatiens glandulifera TaxID=253017 RepID=UPI001FB0C758|nr:calmodulin-binding transcription activator 5-like isoform X2 [Impatiens glandulifera]
MNFSPMENKNTALVGWETHGFRTIGDLDVHTMFEEAKARWLRPNEIYAMLCNCKYFNVKAKPVNLPQSGTILLFDRKTLRNFRKDGHSWKKKKDGKTVKEAHEHLKVGNEERIHVYYAHGEDMPTFVRRCYWLLDKASEHIVLVHYRETQEMQGSPATHVDSHSSSGISNPSAPLLLLEEIDSTAGQKYYNGEKNDIEPGALNYEKRLHEINTLEWEELLAPHNQYKSDVQAGFQQHNQDDTYGYTMNGNIASINQFPLISSFGNSGHLTADTCDSLGALAKTKMANQDSFGRLMSYIMVDSPTSVDGPLMESSISTGHESIASPTPDYLQSSVSGEIFSITDVSPAWAFSDEETKILITGFFHEGYPQFANSKLYCVCGEACSSVEMVQSGVFRCLVFTHVPGSVDLYLSFDGFNPISQVMSFKYRAQQSTDWIIPSEDKFKWEEFQIQMRLSHLLFSSKGPSILSSKISPNALKEAKSFAHKASHVTDGWSHVIKSVKNSSISLKEANNCLLELTLKHRLYEWLLERILDGSKISGHDDQGQGVIHLCAILDYTWSVHPFALSSLSLDYRDKFGWTALHWAACYGREKMVAALLSAGAKPNLVSDPNSENPSGFTAADIASKNGYEGLAAYLAEKALVQHFKDMSLAGNISGTLETNTADSVNLPNLNDEELYLKDTLAAYRTAADAAARIQSAFRQHSFMIRTKTVESSNPEAEARNIVAAMKIQHAYRNFTTKKKIAAAARIQLIFRTWKIRKEFLTMRRKATKIQAVFRGYQVRRQYKKIVWSVGVVEKAILRWRLKRKGFRGLRKPAVESVVEDERSESEKEEAFFRASRKQAEERIERSVVSVQTMFRSKKAQEEYRRMKLAHDQATLEFQGLVNPDMDMGGCP